MAHYREMKAPPPLRERIECFWVSTFPQAVMTHHVFP